MSGRSSPLATVGVADDEAALYSRGGPSPSRSCHSDPATTPARPARTPSSTADVAGLGGSPTPRAPHPTDDTPTLHHPQHYHRLHQREGSDGGAAAAAAPSLQPGSATRFSVERRSVTVMLDSHPLAGTTAAAGAAPAPPSAWGTGGSSSPTPAATSVGSANAPLLPSRAPPPMFAHDFESPGNAAGEEMDSMDHSRCGGSSGAGVESPSLAAALTSPLAPMQVGVPASVAQQSAERRRRQSDMAVVAVRQITPGSASLGDSSGGTSGGERSVLPTPYPVTSTSSLRDWSSAPRLGFPPPSDAAVATAEVASQPYRDAVEQKREDKWYRLCRGVSLLASATPESIVKLRAVARECGIPHHLRGVMWLTLTGMALKVDENEYFCAQLLRRNGYMTGPHADAIAADVQRTFPGHPYFSDKDVGIYKLTNVLHALCWRNPLLSYCQSFNFLAAFLLLILDDEERVFWLLVHIFEELLPNDFYGETLLGANVEQVVLEQLVEKKLPRIAAKFREAGLQVNTLVANWIMSLFVNVFPTSTALHVWDYVLCRTPTPGERTTAHLEVTLATLKLLDDAGLLGSGGNDAGDLLVALREQTACLFDATALIRQAQSLAITQAELHQLRRQCKPAVVGQMKAREHARAARLEWRVTQELRDARGGA
ncbi:GTPase activator protein [Novymonas esmeraldas]|uniref:GTPase activator protein n=1 Tax=Novymonas esmeraldas TaxID=1808958 RepID=A0AAW0F3V0_9TRYP